MEINTKMSKVQFIRKLYVNTQVYSEVGILKCFKIEPNATGAQRAKQLISTDKEQKEVAFCHHTGYPP